LKTLALIPARGGSKGVPRKNVRLLAGKPLIAWTIEAALASEKIDGVVVSTDDDEIAEISRRWGASVPFKRPALFAQDDSPSIDTILHAIDQLPDFESILVLQPTSPLRTVYDIDGCLEFASMHNANAVVSVTEPADSPYWMYLMNNENELKKLIDLPDIARRQELPQVYALNGALYFANRNWLRKTRTFFTDETKGYVMQPEVSFDIDTPLDFKLAELLMSETHAVRGLRDTNA